MKALTLWPEWAWAIINLGKDVENRSWVIPPGLYALHAGKRFSGKSLSTRHREEALESVRVTAHGTLMLGEQWDALDQIKDALIPVGHVVGMIRVTGHTDYRNTDEWRAPMNWAAPGQIANHIELVSVLPTPIPCKGALGLWTVPTDIQHTLETVCQPD